MEGSNRYLAECLTDGWEEISQEANLNANARLFRRRDVVRKLYTADAENNISVLEKLADRKDLENIPELVLPRKILSEGGKICGYEMALARGRTWSAMAGDPDVPAAEKLLALERAADALLRFPPDLIWGDVHGDNIIVGDDGIRIVDPDGLGLSCPQETYADWLPERYRKADGTLRISRETDILGLCDLALTVLLNGYGYYTLPERWRERYLTFLERHGAGALAETVRSTTGQAGNVLIPGAFAGVGGKNLSYETFLKESGLWKEEEKSEKMIDRWIKERRKDE